MESPPPPGTFCTHLRCLYSDKTGTERRMWLPVYIMPITQARCSGTGMHRAVFPDMTQAYDHHRNLCDRMEYSTILPPVGPVECRLGEMEMSVPFQTYSQWMDAAVTNPVGARIFDSPKVDLVEGQPISHPPFPDFHFGNVVNMMHQSFGSTSLRNFPTARSKCSSLEDCEPPLDLLFHKDLGQTEDAPIQNLKQLEASASRDLKQSLPDHVSSWISNEGTKLTLLTRPNHLEVEDPMPTRYQQEDFTFGEHSPVYCDLLSASPRPIAQTETDMIETTTSQSVSLAQDALLQPSSSSSITTEQAPALAASARSEATTTINASPSTPSWEFVDNPSISTTTTVETTNIPSPSPPLPFAGRAVDSVAWSVEIRAEGDKGEAQGKRTQTQTDVPRCLSWEEVGA